MSEKCHCPKHGTIGPWDRVLGVDGRTYCPHCLAQLEPIPETLRLSPDQISRLHQADWRGDGFFYLPEDLEWAVEPTSEDPGVNEPKPNATPYTREGYPV